MQLVSEFTAFIKERWSIHLKRQAGKPAPWTKDPILATYRFCNVRREDDRVTRWIHTRWLEPHKNDAPGVIFAMAMARIVNLPASLEALGYPKRYEAGRFSAIMNGRRSDGYKTFTSAYMINARECQPGQSKADYIALRVLPEVWAHRKSLTLSLEKNGLAGLHHSLVQMFGWGSFMAAQVVADVKWIPVGLKARDWYTFAAPGPGSKRGMSWVVYGDVTKRMNDKEWQEAMVELRRKVLPKLPMALRDLDAQNLQNCLCEFSKNMKVKSGIGRPKQFFTPNTEETYQ